MPVIAVVTSYTVALFCHILGALLFASGIVLAGLPFEIARRRREPGEIAVILGIARAGVPLVGLGTLMLLGFGLWLVHLGSFGFDALWVNLALALFIAALVLGGIGGGRPKRARVYAAKLASEGRPLDDELHALLNDPVSRIINYISSILVLVILGLMVFKPY